MPSVSLRKPVQSCAVLLAGMKQTHEIKMHLIKPHHPQPSSLLCLLIIELLQEIQHHLSLLLNYNNLCLMWPLLLTAQCQMTYQTGHQTLPKRKNLSDVTGAHDLPDPAYEEWLKLRHPPSFWATSPPWHSLLDQFAAVSPLTPVAVNITIVPGASTSLNATLQSLTLPPSSPVEVVEGRNMTLSKQLVLAAKTVESEGFCSRWIFWTILNDSEAHDISK